MQDGIGILKGNDKRPCNILPAFLRHESGISGESRRLSLLLLFHRDNLSSVIVATLKTYSVWHSHGMAPFTLNKLRRFNLPISAMFPCSRFTPFSCWICHLILTPVPETRL